MLNNEHILLATKFTQLLFRAMLHRARYCYCKSSVCLSVTLRYRDHIGWNSSKMISRLELWCSLSTDPNIADLGYSKGNTLKFWPE